MGKESLKISENTSTGADFLLFFYVWVEGPEVNKAYFLNVQLPENTG